MDGAERVEVRRAEPRDLPEIRALLARSLGWAADARDDAFFEWKHVRNPFGASPSWVAVSGQRLVGVRMLMRWRFERDGAVISAVRAVDTATHPDFRGRGIFTRLTLHALEELRAEGVAFVFNTPNEQSRPGYLKMGWVEIARPRRYVSSASWPRAARALLRRGPATSRWSAPLGAGESAGEALADDHALGALLATQQPAGMRTLRTPAWLRWRYGFAPLGYRVLSAATGLADGFLVARPRRRGATVAAYVCEVIVPGGDRFLERALLQRAAREFEADYLVVLHPAGGLRPAFVPLPRPAGVVVWRALCEATPPSPATWRLSMGDVELF